MKRRHIGSTPLTSDDYRTAVLIMSLIHTLIAKGTTVLAEHSTSHGAFKRCMSASLLLFCDNQLCSDPYFSVINSGPSHHPLQDPAKRLQIDLSVRFYPRAHATSHAEP